MSKTKQRIYASLVIGIPGLIFLLLAHFYDFRPVNLIYFVGVFVGVFFDIITEQPPKRINFNE